jgi:hypothetical protein
MNLFPRHICFSALCIHIAFFLLTPAHADEPASAYQTQTLHGFTILVHPELQKHPQEAKDALDELASQLQKVIQVMPEDKLQKLRLVTIWLEWEKKPRGAAEYHVSAGWLKQNGYIPEKLDSVEINNARNFVKWSRTTQPWMVLHELAHAYHHRVLGVNDRGVEAAFQQAVERKLYESVAFVTGGKRKAYAITNSREYFAEISEAYFGKNDFFPFDRKDLETHDPVGFQLMQRVWGEKKGDASLLVPRKVDASPFF